MIRTEQEGREAVAGMIDDPSNPLTFCLGAMIELMRLHGSRDERRLAQEMHDFVVQVVQKKLTH